uniref:Uncharacterized protein n=1 Tax=Kalanchoe fedtschenkoi TaxID=63787 RepID=A0A7N0T312_KALFE
MAFHVACPITCNKICFCDLGFPRALRAHQARHAFLHDVFSLSAFLPHPSPAAPLPRDHHHDTLQVAVPKLLKPPPPPPPEADDAALLLSAQSKRVALQAEAAFASLAAEDFATKFETGEHILTDALRDVGGDQGLTHANVMCRMCFQGENEGSERSRKMLSCKDCGKKYHRSCIKNWGKRRDLFHWNSWTCPSCRICEVCHRTGDPNKFMFCKRCDSAYHCYCQQPPHKTVGTGPYLCPKHTKCHSCGSTVPGNGLSLRWFLGYTCCDACGRLFTKGNYCPVCLKVYRDSESTPMVCCDVCQRWVHCHCDGISDEKYMQFQVDNNLQYVCATCRGECYQVKDLEDAVKELWRRRDEIDQDLIASLRAAAGLPTDEELYYVSSDDEENSSIMLKNDFGRSLKFSLKGVVDKSAKKPKDYGKKFSTKKHMKKKGLQMIHINNEETNENLEDFQDAKLNNICLHADKIQMVDHSTEERDQGACQVVLANHGEGTCSVNQPGALKRKFVDNVTMSSEDKTPRIVKLKSSNSQDNSRKGSGNSNAMRAPKLVIHLGRNKNPSNSPISDSSSHQREHELNSSQGEENDLSVRIKSHGHAISEGNKPNLGKVTPEVYVPDKFMRRSVADGEEPTSQKASTLIGKRNIVAIGPVKESISSRSDRVSSRNQLVKFPDVSSKVPENVSKKHDMLVQNDSKPLLKLKFKNPYFENPSSWVTQNDDEKSLVKGQRSKRKRSSNLEKLALQDKDTSRTEQGHSVDASMDANWILKRLGKDAIGKRVEVHQPSDNSWHRGTVADVIEGKSKVSINLDDGRSKTVELGKHGVRFVPKKQKQSKK